MEPIRKLTTRILPQLTSERKTQLSEVELTPEETEVVLMAARDQKKTRLALEAYNKRLDEEIEYHEYSTEEFRSEITRVANYMVKQADPKKSFILDEWNREIFDTLCLYFNNDPAFETIDESYSLNKGIMLYGNVGCGKTFMMKLFSLNPKLTFRVFHAKLDIQIGYKNGGEEEIEPMYRMLNNNTWQQDFGHKECGLCIDDLGTEEAEVSYYGNRVNLLRGIIEGRYANVSKNATHYTTNLSSEQIGQMYGLRVRDRLRETVNLISFNPSTPTRRR